MKHLFVRKSLAQLHREIEGDNRLRRALGPIQLTGLGIGCVIGAGIFVVTGQAAHDKAGPAIMLSFVVAGLYVAFFRAPSDCGLSSRSLRSRSACDPWRRVPNRRRRFF